MSGYTIGEIVVWLVLAAALGFALGWLLRELKCRSEHGARTPAAADTTPVEAPAFSEPSVESATASRATAKKAAAKKAPAKAPAKRAPAKEAPAKKVVTKVATKKAPAKKAPAKKAPAKKVATKTAPAKKTAAKKTAAKKAPTVIAGRFPRSARPLSGGRAPSAAYTIKGNENSMIYHSPESPSYAQTIAETWFKTEADAIAAGFRKPRNM